MGFELEKIATAIGGEGNGFEMERISEAVENGAGGSSGSDSGILFATVDGATMTLNKTWKQIYDAPFTTILMQMPGSTDKGFAYVYEVEHDDNEYIVSVFTGSADNLMVLTTDSEDGYPQRN